MYRIIRNLLNMLRGIMVGATTLQLVDWAQFACQVVPKIFKYGSIHIHNSPAWRSAKGVM